jgi:hypothetical protein
MKKNYFQELEIFIQKYLNNETNSLPNLKRLKTYQSQLKKFLLVFDPFQPDSEKITPHKLHNELISFIQSKGHEFFDPFVASNVLLKFFDELEQLSKMNNQISHSLAQNGNSEKFLTE